MGALKCSGNPKFDTDNFISVKRENIVFQDDSVVFHVSRNIFIFKIHIIH